MKISVIIPAYNAETTISAAVESVILSDMPEVDIIIVNDGSNDRTAQIGEALSSAHSNVHLINQENRGVSAARNTGLDYACGDYVMFLDSDDTYKSDMMRVLFTAVLENDADIAMCGYTAVFNGKTDFLPPFAGVLNSPTEIFEKAVKPIAFSASNGFMGSVCHSIFRRSVIERNGLRFTPEISIAEDLLFLTRFLLCSSRAAAVGKALYIYDIGDTGNTKKFSLLQKKNDDMLNAALKNAVETAKFECSAEMLGNRMMNEVISLILNEARAGKPDGFSASAKRITGYVKEYGKDVRKANVNGRKNRIKKTVALHPVLGILFYLFRTYQRKRGINF